jgi:hypothetical protein
MKSSREISILLLVAMVLTMVSAPLGMASDGVSSTDVDPCNASACGSEPDKGNDDCCETGCQLCSLPCCSGTVMISTLSQVLDSSLTSDGRLVFTTTGRAWVDADPLYHPPRS